MWLYAINNRISGSTSGRLGHLVWNFYNPLLKWNSLAQQNCMDLCRTFSHFLQGTRPSRKARRVSSIVNHRKGFACCSQVHQYKLIVVPSNILNGLLTTLHLQLTHSTPHQLRNVFDWYFFALNSSAAIHYWTDYWTIHYWTMLHLSVVKDLTD